MNISQAVKEGDIDAVKRCLGRGEDINQKDKNGNSCLAIACDQGHLNVVTFLLENGASIELENNFGSTPLLWAAQNGNSAVVELLLDHGANINHQNKNGCSALFWASEKGHANIVTLLLKKGADIDSQNNNGNTALLSAAAKGNLETVKFLLYNGANINHQNKNGETCIHIACLHNQKQILFHLLERGGDFDLKNNEGLTALDALRAKELTQEKEKDECVSSSETFIHRQQQGEGEERKNGEIEMEESQQREKQREIERNRELVSSLSYQLQQKDQEISSLQSQLSSTVASLRRSEERIRELEAELISKSSREEGNYLRNLQELKSMVVERFKQLFKRKQETEINETKRQKYLELTEKIKITKGKMALASLNSQLQSLNYDPNNVTENKPVDMIPLERIESQAKELYEDLQSREKQFMVDKDFVSSMLCEVDRLNLLNLMKVFEVEVNLDLGEGEGENGENENEKVNENQEITDLRQELTRLKEENSRCHSELLAKEEELKNCEFVVSRYQRKEGIGLKNPHVRFLDVGREVNLKDMGRCLNGIFHNQDGIDFPCKLKVAVNGNGNGNGNEDQSQFEEQLRKLEREKANLEIIRRRDPHQQESSKFIVNWLFPSQLLTEESIYFLSKDGDLITPRPRPRQAASQRLILRMSGLVFECGGMNLKEYLKNESVRSVPMTQRVHILEEIVDAVRFLHKLEMVHFDLKPENIVLFTSVDSHSTKTRWKLIDFDSSYDEKCSPLLSGESRNVWLTEEIVCPEVLRALFPLTPYSSTPKSHSHSHSRLNSPFDTSLSINWRMDIWSLGLVAFFILTNRSFWSEHSAIPCNHSMVTRITQDEIQLVLSRAMKHHEREKSFVESCLQVDPAGRWSGTMLLTKSIFWTGNSTIQADTLELTKEKMLTRLDEIQQLLRDSHEESSLLVNDELSSKFEDFYYCLKSLSG